MHNKFAVIDGITVWSGSGSINYTSTAFNYNHEHAVKVMSASVAGQYEAQFNTMFGNGLPLTAGGPVGSLARSRAAGPHRTS
ncbi:MAG TPA: phospholipase D-like domain-containing protein [Kofleriaceae bacterium]|nr:phospholipase D-like domain-containing protein [Kofleriaceae bacterium]